MKKGETIMICIECGKEAELYDNLCEECFKAKKQFISVPQIIDLKICKHCGARERGKQWLDSTSIDEAAEASVLDNIVLDNDVETPIFEFKFDHEDDKNLKAYIVAFLKIKGLHIKSEHIIKVRLKNSVCNRCSKIAGDYYEAILQIRAEERHLEPGELKKAIKMVEDEISIMQKNDRNIFVSKFEKIHGGLDFYIGSSQACRNLAKNLASTFGGKVSSHPSFAGHKDGHGVYRTTFLVKLPRFRNGDIVDLNGKVLQILSSKTTKITTMDLAKGVKIYVKPNEFQTVKILGGEELIQDAVVVSETKNELQILDPDTYKTKDVVKPRSFQVTDETVKIIKYADSVYLMPQ